MTFFARPCSTILPVTLALDASEPAKTFFSSVCTASTVPNFTCSPTSPFTRSMRMVSPGATRYCFPPVCITAYIIPPRAKDKPQLYAAFPTSVNALLSAQTGCGKSLFLRRLGLQPQRNPCVLIRALAPEESFCVFPQLTRRTPGRNSKSPAEPLYVVLVQLSF